MRPSFSSTTFGSIQSYTSMSMRAAVAVRAPDLVAQLLLDPATVMVVVLPSDPLSITDLS